ncbi:MAG: SDR family NAD(P)-dependent oxidoreductase [Myxococcales bacterium]|nr:SDR family NAD(P)-dependent oxidoreductase [Myxococcales bacterium]MCB9706237.1 SDR family NAD(P)-dependent oxidoreductase [Myxococcales bacterium]
MHVLITGASSGIGEAIAREYMRRGAKVTLVARRRPLLEALAAEAAAGHAHVIERDLSVSAEAPTILDEAEAALGPIDVLINNAGVQIVAPIEEVAIDDAERLLHVDLHTPLRLTHAIVPRMIARGAGTIVDIASVAGLAPTPGMYFYNAAKAALGAASEGLRAELRPHGIHVVTVYPGPVESAMEAAARTRYEASAVVDRLPTGKPAILARRIADAVARRRSRVIYPRFYTLSRHFPALALWITGSTTPPLRRAKKG